MTEREAEQRRLGYDPGLARPVLHLCLSEPAEAHNGAYAHEGER